MYTINGKPQTKVLSQRIHAGVLQDYLNTKSEYNKIIVGKVNTAQHIEELLTTLTLEMNSAINQLHKEQS
jgi:hypothetical protein